MKRLSKNLIHKSADISKNAKIGENTAIWQNCQILAGAKIGTNCTIGHNCFIASKAKVGNGVKIQSNIDIWDLVTIEDYVFIGPSAVFTNDPNPRAKYPKKDFFQYGKWQPTLVKEGATIGANATILCGIEIGRWAMIGAGSVVTKNIPDYGLVIGVPAKLNGWVCECGNRLAFKKNSAVCSICRRKYQKRNKCVFPAQ